MSVHVLDRGNNILWEMAYAVRKVDQHMMSASRVMSLVALAVIDPYPGCPYRIVSYRTAQAGG